MVSVGDSFVFRFHSIFLIICVNRNPDNINDLVPNDNINKRKISTIDLYSHRCISVFCFK